MPDPQATPSTPLEKLRQEVIDAAIAWVDADPGGDFHSLIKIQFLMNRAVKRLKRQMLLEKAYAPKTR